MTAQATTPAICLTKLGTETELGTKSIELDTPSDLELAIAICPLLRVRRRSPDITSSTNIHVHEI